MVDSRECGRRFGRKDAFRGCHKMLSTCASQARPAETSDVSIAGPLSRRRTASEYNARSRRMATPLEALRLLEDALADAKLFIHRGDGVGVDLIKLAAGAGQKRQVR